VAGWAADSEMAACSGDVWAISSYVDQDLIQEAFRWESHVFSSLSSLLRFSFSAPYTHGYKNVAPQVHREGYDFMMTLMTN
jgi:hypothetical protein